MTRSVFYGFNAYIGSIKGATSCAWWPADPASHGYNPALLIDVDLARCPQGVRNGTIALALMQLDDFQGWGGNGQTRIGPMFPGGTMNGTCWLETGFYNGLPNKPPRLPAGAQCHDYELCNLLDWKGTTTIARYQGCYAEILAVAGGLAQTSVWLPGTSRIPGQPPIGTYWLDLGHGFDPIGAYTKIGIGPNDPKSGALFVAYGGVIPLSPPKHPVTLGGAVPRRHHVDR
jgi:hypothetical protein